MACSKNVKSGQCENDKVRFDAYNWKDGLRVSFFAKYNTSVLLSPHLRLLESFQGVFANHLSFQNSPSVMLVNIEE